MKLQTKIINIQRTPRTKSVLSLPQGLILTTHYDGSIILNNRIIQIVNVPIRASCFHQNYLLLGNDNGEITVHDINGTKIRTILVHSDFVRSIDSNQEIFVTGGDDFTVKVFKDFKPVSSMNHDHFVMSVKISGDRIFSAGLDSSIRIWDLSTFELRGSIKNQQHSINNIFIFRGILISCSDDGLLNIYNNENLRLLQSINLEKGILCVIVVDNLLIAGTEDGRVCIFSKGWSLIETLHPGLGRVWGLGCHDGVLIIGCDEGVQTARLFRSGVLSTSAGDKIIFISDGIVYKVSADTISKDSNPCIDKDSNPRMDNPVIDSELAIKDKSIERNKGIRVRELKILKSDVQRISATARLVAIEEDQCTQIYSLIGFRHRETVEGIDFIFTENGTAHRQGEIVFIDDQSIEIPGIQSLFSLGNDIFAGTTENSSVIFTSDRIIRTLPSYRRLIRVGNFILGFGNSIDVYNYKEVISYQPQEESQDEYLNTSIKKISNSYIKEIFQHRVESIFVADDLIFFTESDKLFYIIVGNRLFLQFVCIERGVFLGVTGNYAIFKSSEENDPTNEIISYPLDIHLINFQRKVLKGELNAKGDESSTTFNTKRNESSITFNAENHPHIKLEKNMIHFLEELGYYDKILEMTNDPDLRFDVYMKMHKYDDALKVATKISQYRCLGNVLMKSKEYKKASYAFYLGKSYDDALLMSIAGGNQISSSKEESPIKESSIKEFDDNNVNKNSNDDQKDDNGDSLVEEKITINEIDEIIRNNIKDKVSGVLRFILDYKVGDYQSCKKFLKGTEFLDLFQKYHDE